jgi:hypothetical protein
LKQLLLSDSINLRGNPSFRSIYRSGQQSYLFISAAAFLPRALRPFYFFPEETDMRKKSMPKTKKMAMEATP